MEELDILMSRPVCPLQCFVCVKFDMLLFEITFK